MSVSNSKSGLLQFGTQIVETGYDMFLRGILFGSHNNCCSKIFCKYTQNLHIASHPHFFCCIFFDFPRSHKQNMYLYAGYTLIL